MKKVSHLLLIFIFSATFICAEEDEDYKSDEEGEFPPGMRIEKVGDLQILVPIGAEVKRTGKGGLISVEGIDQFMSRKILELEDRFEKLEKIQEELKREVEQLKKTIHKQNKKKLISH